ncbi:MAG: peptide chain release factor N(5)-glutamine methyltransferase [Clostridia bacterium]|nr:peptide chain release factor N(5)-glutamine methyltransferase [Clostridia bacterium]
MKTSDALKYTRERLAAVTDEAAAEAKLILSHYTGKAPYMLAISDGEIGADTLSAIDRAVERRLSREPIQYVLGEWSFMGLDFFTAPDALIPRQDTETLAEEAVRLIRGRGYKSLLDICTGTGCIAVSLNKLTGIYTEASDISHACVLLARRNAERNGVRVSFREADLFEGAGMYDIVTANPPYISDKDMEDIQAEVRFEPELALRGGEDGLTVIRRIAAEAAEHILPGGTLLIEVGAGQTEETSALFDGRKTRILYDLNGIGRTVAIDF